MPACGWKKSFHMIAMITLGIAQGTSASDRASPRPRSCWLSKRARPSAQQNPIAVTETDQITPILNELTKRSSWSSVRKLSSPMNSVGKPKPACELVKPR